MRAAVNVFVRWGVLAALQVGIALGAAAAQEATAEEAQGATAEDIPREDAGLSSGSRQRGADRWVPSLAVTSGITIQEWQGSVASEICQGCTLPSPLATPLRPAESGNDIDVTPFVGGNLELMTPEISIPTSPRLFAGGGISFAFGADRNVAQEGNPGTLKSPLPAGTTISTPFSEEAVLGQGSQTSAQFQTLLYEAHAGIAFPLELFERALRLKPSLGWVHYEVEAKGLISDAECRNNPNAPPPTNCNPQTTPTAGVLRTIELTSGESRSFDGLGGGVDLEMDTYRFGPIGSSLYLGAHVFGVLGNRNIEFSAAEQFESPVPPVPGLGAADTSADFDVELDEVIYRVGLGLRLHWLGSTE